MGIFNNHERKVIEALCKKSEDISNDISKEIHEFLDDLKEEYEQNKVASENRLDDNASSGVFLYDLRNDHDQERFHDQDTCTREDQKQWSRKRLGIGFINIVEGHKRIKYPKDHLVQLL